MAYAHQGIAIKPIRGLASPATLAALEAAPPKTVELGAPARPAALSRGALDALGEIESKIKLLEAKRAPAPPARPVESRNERR
jgi:penicillin-binding protein 1A